MTGYALESGGRHDGWDVWALVRQRLDARSVAGLSAVTAQREPVAILLHRAGDTRAFALSDDFSDPERLAREIRMAR